MLSTQSFPRKLDQVIANEADAKQRFNLPAFDGQPRHTPERPPIVGEQADAHQQIGHERQAALQVGSRQPRTPGRRQPISIGRLDLVREARVQPLRIVSIFDGQCGLRPK